MSRGFSTVSEFGGRARGRLRAFATSAHAECAWVLWIESRRVGEGPMSGYRLVPSPTSGPSDRNRRSGDAIYMPRETMSNDTTVTRCDDAVRVMVTMK